MELLNYDSRPLARSPLVMVAAQVNFEEVGPDVQHQQARAIQKRLGAKWVVLVSAPLVSATLTPDGPVHQPKQQAYRISTKDDSWAVHVRPDAVTLETRTYSNWGEFSEAFSAASEAVADVFDPALCKRIGLRYVDQIPLPDGRDSWDGLIADSLLGLAADDRFRTGVVATEQRTLLQYEDGARCVLRHGLFSDDSTQNGFLLDYDVFSEGSDPYVVGDIVARAEGLHDHMGRTFRTSLTDALYDWLAGVE